MSCFPAHAFFISTNRTKHNRTHQTGEGALCGLFPGELSTRCPSLFFGQTRRLQTKSHASGQGSNRHYQCREESLQWCSQRRLLQCLSRVHVFPARGARRKGESASLFHCLGHRHTCLRLASIWTYALPDCFCLAEDEPEPSAPLVCP